MVNSISMAQICQGIIKHYNFAEYVDHQAVTHGLTHTSFKLNTKKGSYIMKCLHKVMPYDISTALYTDYYEESYKVSMQLSDMGIPAVVPYAVAGHLICHRFSPVIAVFDWVEGERLKKNEISVSKAYIIGKLLAKMHQSKIRNLSAERVLPLLDAVSSRKWNTIMAKLHNKQFIFTDDLRKSLPLWLDSIVEYHKNYYLLQQNVVIGHNDLIPANVIWQDINPYIVDWDFIGWVNPMQELLTTAFTWSGIRDQSFNQAVLHAMVESYAHHGGNVTPDINFVLDSIIARLLTQLQFRLKQLFSHVAEDKKNQFLEEKIMELIRTINYFVSQYDHFVLTIESFKKFKKK